MFFPHVIIKGHKKAHKRAMLPSTRVPARVVGRPLAVTAASARYAAPCPRVRFAWTPLRTYAKGGGACSAAAECWNGAHGVRAT